LKRRVADDLVLDQDENSAASAAASLKLSDPANAEDLVKKNSAASAAASLKRKNRATSRQRRGKIPRHLRGLIEACQNWQCYISQ